MASVKSENGQFNTLTNKAGSGAPVAPSGLSLGSSSDVFNMFQNISTNPALAMAVPGTSAMTVVAKNAVKIGNIFFFHYTLSIVKGTGTGAVNITLPVSRLASGESTHQAYCDIHALSGFSAGASKMFKAITLDGTASCALCTESLDTGAIAFITDANLSATAVITIQGFYFI